MFFLKKKKFKHLYVTLVDANQFSFATLRFKRVLFEVDPHYYLFL